MAAVSSYLGPDGTRLMGMPSPGGAPLFAHGESRRADKTAAVRVANAAAWPMLTWRVAGSSRTSAVSAEVRKVGSTGAMTGSSVAALGITTTTAGCCCTAAATVSTTVASNGTASLRGLNLVCSLMPPSPVAVVDVVVPAVAGGRAGIYTD